MEADDIRKWNNLSSRTARRALKVGSLLYVWSETTPVQPVQEKAGTVLAQKAPPPTAPVAAPAPAAPAKSPAAVASVRPGAVHALAAGESVWKVAQRYGVTVEDIKRWNNIKDTQHLPTGLKLTVSAP